MGRDLATLAARFVQKLPRAEALRPHWQLFVETPTRARGERTLRTVKAISRRTRMIRSESVSMRVRLQRISSAIVQIKVSLVNSIAAPVAQRNAAIERMSLQTGRVFDLKWAGP
jgi:hypothetical protein